jgi:hypothetical protein
MGAGDVVLKLAADVSQYIASMAKAGEATKQIGNIGDKAGRGLEEGMTRALLKVESIKKAMQAVGASIDEIANKGEKASRTQGQRAVGLATSLNDLGVENISKTMRNIQIAKGGTTIDERTAFVDALAASQKDALFKVDSGTAESAIDAFAKRGSLVFGKGGTELIEGLKQGKTVDDITRDAMKARPGLFGISTDTEGPIATELGLRALERRSQLAEEAKRAKTAGIQTRLGKSIREGSRGDDPLGEALTGLVEAVPGTENALNLNAGKGEGERVKDAIDEQTKFLRSTTDTSLNLTGKTQ